MRFFGLFLLLVISALKVSAQSCSNINFAVSSSTNSSSKDTTVCKGSNLALYSSLPVLKSTNSYTVASIPFIDTLPCESSGSVVAGSGISLDDAYSTVQNIGFNFCFYGVQHSQFQICDNGFITFTTTKTPSVSLSAPYVTRTLPLPTHPNAASTSWPTTPTLPPNSILGAWMDTYLETGGSNPGGGTITRQTVGTAPFRACIIKWNDCRYYFGACRSQSSMVLNMKIVLYETTNLIEVHIKTKPLCVVSGVSRYNTVQAIQGDSTFKYLVTPGRNNTLWNGANTAYRFIPAGSTISTTVQWKKNGTVVSNAAIANVTATDDSAYYVATASIIQPCPAGTMTIKDSVKVYGLNVEDTSFHYYDTIYCQGTKNLNVTKSGVLNYRWEDNSTSPARTVSTGGTYSAIRFYNALGCKRDTVYYHITQYSDLNIDSFKRIGCFNSGNIGQIQLFVSGDTTGLLMGINSNPTSNQNPIPNQGYGNQMYWISNAGNCRDSINLFNDSLKYVYEKRVNKCDQDSSGLMRIIPSGGYSPFTYGLSGRSNQFVDSFNNIGSGIYTISVMDKNNCTLSKTDTIVPFTDLSLSISTDSVKCYGGNTGRIMASLSGGTPSYYYSVDNGPFSSNGVLSGLSSGVHIVKTKDSANCPIDTSITLYEYPQINASITKQPNCPFDTNGSIIVTASGGNSGYTYRLNSGSYQSSNMISGMIDGLFGYTVKDAYNCERTFFDTLYPHNQPLISLQSKEDLSCYQSNDGKIKVETSSGKLPYTYTWDFSNTSDSAINLSVGTYQTIVTDSNTCKDTLSTIINQPDSLDASFILSNPLCYNQKNGWIKVEVFGGTPTYMCAISPPGTAGFSTIDSFTGLGADTFIILVLDANSCLKSFKRVLSNPPKLSTSILVDSVKCFGANDGRITLNAFGGVMPYRHSINSSTYGSASLFAGLSIGSYNLSIRDTNDCQFDTTSTVYQYPLIQSNVAVVDSISCQGGMDGKIRVTASSGNPPYQYSIDGGAYQNVDSFENLNKGKKIIRIKDANDCIALDSIVLTEPNGTTSTLDIVHHVKCYGAADAKAKVQVMGGVPPYTFTWSNGGSLDSNSNLDTGFNYVLIADNTTCKDSIAFQITQPDSLNADIGLYHPLCFDSFGSIKVQASGGISPIEISFQGGSFSNTDSFSSLTGQAYTIVLRDSNQCQKLYNRALITPSQIIASYSIDSVKCFGDSTGKISISASGGTGTLIYKRNSITQANNIFDSLKAATYLVSIEDDNGCKLDSTMTVYEYSDINVSIVKDTILCFGASSGNLTVNASNGSGSFEYGINGSAFGSNNIFTNLTMGTHTIQVRDLNQCVKSQMVDLSQVDSMAVSPQIYHNPCFEDTLGKVKFLVTGGTSPFTIAFDGGSFTAIDSFVNLSAATYNYTVRDANNCIKSGQISITEPSKLNIFVDIDSVKCFNANTGKIMINADGGTPGYNYSLDGSSFTNNNQFSNLLAGTYTVSVRDINQCEADTIVEVKSSDSFYFSMVLDSLKCNDENIGKVTISPQGGLPAYSYSLNGGLYQSANVFQNLLAGSYSLEVKDAYGCTLSSNFNLLNPSPIIINTDSIFHNKCFGDEQGRVYISSSGGQLPHNYNWSNGSMNSFINGLAVGVYTVSVTDANNCEESLLVSITEPTDFNIVGIEKDISCYGRVDGRIDLTVSGATPPYTYLWSNTKTTPYIDILAGGDYSVTITDSNSCQVDRLYSIVEPDSISFELNETNSSCIESENGRIDILNLMGGNPPYNFNWNHGPTTQNVFNLEPLMTYIVRVTDSKNCMKIDEVFVDTNYSLRLQLVYDTFPKCPNSPVSFRLLPLSGQSAYTYTVGSFQNQTGVFTSIPNAVYPVRMTDANRCQFDTNIDMRPKDTMVADLKLYPPSCKFADVFPVKVNVSGGGSPYTFDWLSAHSVIGDSARYKIKGNHAVDIRDANKCLVRKNFFLKLPDGALDAYIVDKKDLLCYKQNEGAMTIEATGGIPPYTYLWSTGATTKTIDGLEANKMYFVIVIDSDTCLFQVQDTLSQPDSLYFKFQVSPKTCKDRDDGSLSIVASGGVKPYRYSIDTSLEYIGNPIFEPIAEGSYSVYVKDENGCVAMDSTNVDVRYKLNLSIQRLYSVDLGQTVLLEPSISLNPISTYYESRWEPFDGLSCAVCDRPEFNGHVNSTYLLTVNYGEDCKDTISTRVLVSDISDEEIFIPTAFSPSAGNDENKVFKVYANKIVRFHMMVFNRWGEKVFESDDIRVGWDGTFHGEPAPHGHYGYHVELIRLDTRKIIRSGDINLIR